MTGSTILLWHGFMRSPRHLASMIGMLRSANFAVVAPHARGPVAMNRPSTARSAVARLSATQGLQALQSHDSPSAVVIVTHSAGAALGAWSALALPPTVVRGLVFADGTDNLVRGARQSLPMLRGVPIHLVDADPCPCNRYGALSRLVRANHDVVRCTVMPLRPSSKRRYSRRYSTSRSEGACVLPAVSLMSRLRLCWWDTRDWGTST